MNQRKTLFRILDNVILEPLGKEVFNFQSKKTYDFFVNVKDTHKSWQIVRVLLFGTTLELCILYLQEAESNESNAVCFLEIPTLLCQLILNYTLAIYLFKIGVRCNNVKMVNVARFKFEDLFYAFKRPIYREVEYRDLRNRVLYYKKVRNFRDMNMTSREGSIKGKSQGGNFILEVKVQRQKLIAPKGAIKGETWKTLARYLDNFESMYLSVSSKLNLRDSEAPKSIDLIDEIIKWRTILRSSEYLITENYNPLPKNIFDEILSDNMANFPDIVRGKREECGSLIENEHSIVTVTYPLLSVLQGEEIADLLHTCDGSDKD